jgi:glycosyltransferase involved in cell wall biosynthesis
MKRALIFSTAYLPLVGGAEVALQEITNRLPDWQFDLVCAKIKPDLPSIERIGNITVHRCGFGRPLDKYLLPATAVWRALMVGGYRYEGVIWSFLASYNGFAALVYTWLRPRARLFLTLQEGDPLEYYARRTGIFYGLHRRIFQRANQVQAISHFLADWATKMGHTGNVEVIPNGVEVARFAKRISSEERERFRASYGYADEDIVMVTVSRLAKKNAVNDIVQSLVFLPSNYKLLIAGDGEDRGMLGQMVNDLGVKDRVTFLGTKSQDELPSILQSTDMFCRPSLSEGLGISFLEAMAAGTPIIATPVGGIPDFLHDGETGIFCQPHDPESIARAAIRIETEPGLREKLIRQGSELVQAEYDWNKIAMRLETLLLRV